jgi:hypothetical protein
MLLSDKKGNTFIEELMSSTKIEQKCVECNVVFERSKFNPYLDRCEKHRPKKVGKRTPQPKKDKKNKEEQPTITLPLPDIIRPKKVMAIVEKEKIFIHLLNKGWKISANNRLHKTSSKVKVIATLGAESPSSKFSVVFFTGEFFGGFDGSMTIMEKAQLKHVPAEIFDDLEPILDYIWPEEKKDGA